MENIKENVDNVEQVAEAEIDNSTEQSSQETDFAKKDEEEKEEEKKEESDSESKSDDAEEDHADKNDDEEEDKKKKMFSYDEDMEAKYSALEEQFNELQAKFSALEDEAKSLKEFKTGIEDAQKDEMIASFYMLSEEDKKDVIANKSSYSLDEIEAKLSVICVRNKVSCNLDSESSEEQPVTTFNLNETESDMIPAWLKAVENHRK